MPLLRYVGSIDEVYLRDVGAYVKRGETVDVPDEDIAANLIEQETFVAAGHAKTTHTKPAAKTEE